MTGSSLILLPYLSFAVERLRSFRQDLKKNIPLLCSEHQNFIAYEFLKHGIYDSQILIFLFRNSQDSIKVFKNKEAYKAFYGEFIAPCREYNLGVLTRSSEALKIYNGELSIPSDLEKMCSSIYLNFIHAHYGRSRSIPVSEKISLPQDDGVLSLSCMPKDHPLWGKETWFLVPTGKGPDKLAPERHLLLSQSSPSEKMQSWLNAIRVREDLSPLNFKNTFLQEIAEQLGKSRSIEHDRVLNRALQKKARDKGYFLVGENRAQARTLHELAWLLWNSPRHRDLLLSKEARWASLSLNYRNKVWFLVWAFAAKKEKSDA